MKYTLAAVIAVSSLSSFAAQAGEPFVLSDASLDSVTAAGNLNFNTVILKNVDINKTVNVNVNKNVATNVDLNGSLASAEASADSTGWFYNLAETETFAQVTAATIDPITGLVTPGGAFAFSDALAAGNDGFIVTAP